MTENLAADELETLRKGALGAGLLVSLSDRGFFDTFKEAGTMSKHVASARGSAASDVVRQIAEGHGLGFGVTTPPDRIEAETLEALRSSVQLLQSKAPTELDAYRVFVLDLARSVAAAAPGGEEAEAATISKLESALAVTQTSGRHASVEAGSAGPTTAPSRTTTGPAEERPCVQTGPVFAAPPPAPEEARSTHSANAEAPAILAA